MPIDGHFQGPKFGGAWKPPVSRAARVGNGRLLMDFGLDVANATPEGTSILDGLVAYARSPSFAPISELDIAAISSNGE